MLQQLCLLWFYADILIHNNWIVEYKKGIIPIFLTLETNRLRGSRTRSFKTNNTKAVAIFSMYTVSLMYPKKKNKLEYG